MKDLGELLGQRLLPLQVLHGGVRRAGQRLQQAAQGVLCGDTSALATLRREGAQTAPSVPAASKKLVSGHDNHPVTFPPAPHIRGPAAGPAGPQRLLLCIKNVDSSINTPLKCFI